MRIALGVEYSGKAYCGWQSQPMGLTVQDKLEAALATFIGQPISTICAGRTDAGVHALGQVVHLDTEIVRESSAWVRGTNRYLPPDIRVLWAKPVSDVFHARFSARSRTYRYFLLNDAMGSAVLHGLAGWFHAPLQLADMQEAARGLLGEHDFSAFRAAGCQAKTPMKTLYQADIAQLGPWFIFTFRASAFLHHMVRNMVGALVYVGAGRHQIADFHEIFTSRNRINSAPTFAPDGLYLSAIEYDPCLDLPTDRQRLPFFVTL